MIWIFTILSQMKVEGLFHFLYVKYCRSQWVKMTVCCVHLAKGKSSLLCVNVKEQMPTWPTEKPFGPGDTHMLEEMIPAEDHILYCHKSYCEKRERDNREKQIYDTLILYCIFWECIFTVNQQNNNKGKQMQIKQTGSIQAMWKSFC